MEITSTDAHLLDPDQRLATCCGWNWAFAFCKLSRRLQYNLSHFDFYPVIRKWSSHMRHSLLYLHYRKGQTCRKLRLPSDTIHVINAAPICTEQLRARCVNPEKFQMRWAAGCVVRFSCIQAKRRSTSDAMIHWSSPLYPAIGFCNLTGLSHSIHRYPRRCALLKPQTSFSPTSRAEPFEISVLEHVEVFEGRTKALIYRNASITISSFSCFYASCLISIRYKAIVNIARRYS